MNHETRLANVEAQCLAIMAPLQGLDGVSVRMMDNTIGHQPFGVELIVDKSATGYSNDELVDLLKEGDPRIWVRTTEPGAPIVMHGFGLGPGEAELVGETIAKILSS